MSMGSPLSPTTVGPLLSAAETRGATLEALGLIVDDAEPAMAQATAVALTEVLTKPASEVNRTAFRRAGLLRGRLAVGAPNPALVYSAANRDGRLQALCTAPDSVVGAMLRLEDLSVLTTENAIDYCCLHAFEAPSTRYGATRPYEGCGGETVPMFHSLLGTWSLDPALKGSATKIVVALGRLLLDLLDDPSVLSTQFSSEDISLIELGVAVGLTHCTSMHHSHHDLEWARRFFNVSAARLHAIGSPMQWMGGRDGWFVAYMSCPWVSLLKTRATDAERPDVEAFVASGLLDLSIAAVQAYEARGAAMSRETHPLGLLCIFGVMRLHPHLDTDQRGRLRQLASAFAFALREENCVDWTVNTGQTPDAYCCQVVCGLFGRDEAEEEEHTVSGERPSSTATTFHFTQAQVDTMLKRWCSIVTGNLDGKFTKLSPDAIQTLELCISDTNKPLLLVSAAG